MKTLAEGRVFTGRMAKEAGLVDRLGTLDDAIDEARTLAGLADDEPLDRVLLPEPRGLFEDLFGTRAGRGRAGRHSTTILALIDRVSQGLGMQPLAAAWPPSGS